MYDLYSPENEDELRSVEQAENEISAADSNARTHFQEALSAHPDDLEAAAMYLYEEYIYETCLRHSHHGAIDTVARDSILESLGYEIERFKRRQEKDRSRRLAFMLGLCTPGTAIHRQWELGSLGEVQVMRVVFDYMRCQMWQ